ncbi:MAG: hypothetical protein WBC73_04035 [Phormidesmis sp.]
MIKAIASYILYPLVERQQKRQISPKLARLRELAKQPPSAKKQISAQKLYETVALAGRHVPYYRELFQQQSFDPEKLKTDTRYLEDLPYLTKDILRSQGERLLNEQISPDALHVRKTGGSTGPSALIYYDQAALDWTAAANLFVLEQAGKKRYMKEAHFSSRFADAIPYRDKLKESIKCITLNRVNITTDTFDADALRAAIAVLKKERPYLVQGHPSTLYRLALQIEKDHASPQRLFTVFESTGEVLNSKQLQTISRVFQCQICDRYGNAEFGVVAHTNAANTQQLSVLTPIVWPETRPAIEDNQELVFTNLTNHAMPLIRYCTGDMGQLSYPSGQPVITDIVGRVHDVVSIGDDVYPTHYIQDFLDRVGGIDEFQLEQQSDGHLKLKLLLINDSDLDRIRHSIAERWNSGIEIECISADDLKLQGWRNKFRHLVAPAN